MEMKPAAMGFDQRFKSDRVADSCRGNEGSLQPQVVATLSQNHGVILVRPWKPRNDNCLDPFLPIPEGSFLRLQADHFFCASLYRPKGCQAVTPLLCLISGFMIR